MHGMHSKYILKLAGVDMFGKMPPSSKLCIFIYDDYSFVPYLPLVFVHPATEHAFKDILTSLPKPGGGEFGKYYSLPALNDPRIGKISSRLAISDWD